MRSHLASVYLTCAETPGPSPPWEGCIWHVDAPWAQTLTCLRCHLVNVTEKMSPGWRWRDCWLWGVPSFHSSNIYRVHLSAGSGEGRGEGPGLGWDFTLCYVLLRRSRDMTDRRVRVMAISSNISLICVLFHSIDSNLLLLQKENNYLLFLIFYV